MDEQQTTIQEVISNKIYIYSDTLDNTEIKSEEHKEAFRNFAESVKLLMAADKQANENNLAWARYELESKKAELEAEEVKRQLKRELSKTIFGLLSLLIPAGTTLIKQRIGQSFASSEMEKMCYYEENGTLRSYSGKTAWKFVENEARNN